ELSTTFLAACSLNSAVYRFGFPGTRSRSFLDKNPIGSLSGKFGAPHPVRQAMERDDAAVAVWKDQVWPDIKAPRVTWAPSSALRTRQARG
ncbi:MAG TPA: hypothetical protein VGM38_08270, partial [Pseudolysinimonas sp.]